MRITKTILAAGVLGLSLVSGVIVYGGDIDTRAQADVVVRGGHLLAASGEPDTGDGEFVW